MKLEMQKHLTSRGNKSPLKFLSSMAEQVFFSSLANDWQMSKIQPITAKSNLKEPFLFVETKMVRGLSLVN